MKHLDLQVINQALQWLEGGQPLWLCTVIATFGSAPRGPGSMLVVHASGDHRGSLSGGCVEDDFLQRVQLGQFQSRSEVIRYGEGGLAPTLALPCGGVLDVLVEYFVPDEDSREHFKVLHDALAGAGQVRRTINLGTGGFSLAAQGHAGPVVAQQDAEISILVGPARRLLIAGLSPVAEFCIEFAQALGYEVVVCDARPEELARHEGRWPGVQMLEMLPAVFIANGGCHGATAVVALTHDPRVDDLTLMEAVHTEAFYIGAMGSMKTSQKRRERLVRIASMSDEDMQRIHAPVGLRLGSKTPAEIAIAVMADIVRVGYGITRTQL